MKVASLAGFSKLSGLYIERFALVSLQLLMPETGCTLFLSLVLTLHSAEVSANIVLMMSQKGWHWTSSAVLCLESFNFSRGPPEATLNLALHWPDNVRLEDFFHGCNTLSSVGGLLTGRPMVPEKGCITPTGTQCWDCIRPDNRFTIPPALLCWPSIAQHPGSSPGSCVCRSLDEEAGSGLSLHPHFHHCALQYVGPPPPLPRPLIPTAWLPQAWI